MANLINDNTFVSGGTLPPNHWSYIQREADEKLIQLCQQNEFVIILAARQMGKSSLIAKTSAKLPDNHRTVYLELNQLVVQDMGKTTEQWLLSVLAEIVFKLSLPKFTARQLEVWWHEHTIYEAPVRFRVALWEQVLPLLDGQHLTIFLDEIDFLLEYDIKDGFFAFLRSLYNERHKYPGLNFVFAGVATPDQLIGSATRTPFNVGIILPLTDFRKEDLARYQTRLMQQHGTLQGQRYIDEIYAQTRGHPYLTQLLCQLVYDTPFQQANLSLVSHLVEQTFINPTTKNTHIAHISRLILESVHKTELLRLYLKIIRSIPVKNDNKDIVLNRLKLAGLVVADQDYLKPRNPIYLQRFDEVWVQSQLYDADQVRRMDELEQENAQLTEQVKHVTAELEQARSVASNWQWIAFVLVAFSLLLNFVVGFGLLGF